MEGVLMHYAGIGSRQTPSEILDLMNAVAYRLQELGWTLRSGHADGADFAFEHGAQGKAEIYLPWPGFNSEATPPMGWSATPTPEAYEVAERFHPAWDRCSRGAKALHARNSHQVLGYDLRSPAHFVLCWTPPHRLGGTGQAIRIATANGIPVFNLNDPGIVARTTALVNRPYDEAKRAGTPRP